MPSARPPRSRAVPEEFDPLSSGAVRGRPAPPVVPVSAERRVRRDAPTPPSRPSSKPHRVRASIGRGPLLLLLLIVSLVLTDAAVIDAQRADITAALAADGGRGVKIAVPVRKVHRAAPVTVRIERLGISSTLVDLRIKPNGALQVPADYQRVGWYVGSAHPGDPGPTVLVGHVDSYKGPAVFYKLRQLHPGDVITVGRADKTQARFVVQRVLTVPKKSFPTRLVYVGDGRPSLRLVTCGGAFDRKSGHYLENTVVLAVPEPRAAKAKPLQRRPGKPVRHLRSEER